MANQDIVFNWGLTGRTKPTATADSVYGNMRTGRFGELYTQSLMGGKMNTACDEGSYFMVTNPTPGTGIAGIAAADGFDATESLLHIRNGASTSESTRVYLDSIRLQATAAGTNGTTFNLAMTLDTGVTRYTSGGSALTPFSPNMQTSGAGSCTVKCGALITTAASASVRLLGSFVVRTVIKVIGDTVLIKFGDSATSLSSHIVAGTAIANTIINAPPVVLGPTDQFLLHDWGASQTVGASYEITACWVER